MLVFRRQRVVVPKSDHIKKEVVEDQLTPKKQSIHQFTQAPKMNEDY